MRGADIMTSKGFYSEILKVGRALSLAILLAGIGACQTAAPAVDIDSDDLGGIVSGPEGPEAGVWVIAETTDLPTTFVKIVVTDDEGRYVLPDLPDANYDVWVRGYGLVDSPKVQSAPGEIVNLTSVVAPTAEAAAEIYPPNYWYALTQVPPEDDFPGTGPMGNGINTAMLTQKHWVAQMKGGTGPGIGCSVCHQMGQKAIREMPEAFSDMDHATAWDERVQSGQWGGFMSAMYSFFGRQRATAMFADWTERIAAGEIPPEAPPRPQGVERNVVISQWDWSDERSFVHDTISSDKRDPSVNANGLVFSIEQFGAPDFNILNPANHTVTKIQSQVRDPETPFVNAQSQPVPSAYWGDEIIWSGRSNLHNPMMDQLGRVWLTQTIRTSDNPDYCKAGSDHPSAQHFPLDESGRQLSYYDPATEEFTLVDTCFGTHHLQFAEDDNNTLWSGTPDASTSVLGWVNTAMLDETGDEAGSQGWAPFILDTNGNGQQDAWVEPDEPIDPTRDKRIEGRVYGLIANPVDGSVWAAPGHGAPGYILRMDPGANPPETALTEVYEPPFDNPESPVSGYTPRGIDVDRNGLIWTSLSGSGHIASFDRSQCAVLNGPTATGPHCPEGWTLYPLPGPQLTGTDASADSLYYNWVDQFDMFGLGENVPMGAGYHSNSMLALPPGSDTIAVFNVPYPMGLTPRGFDGRLDDPTTGWKGKGIWTNFGNMAPWHMEGGQRPISKAVKFQLRPDPLAK